MNPKAMMTEDEVEVVRKLVQDGGKLPADTILRALDTIDAMQKAQARISEQELKETTQERDSLLHQVDELGREREGLREDNLRIEAECQSLEKVTGALRGELDSIATLLGLTSYAKPPYSAEQAEDSVYSAVSRLLRLLEPFARVGEVSARFDPPLSKRLQCPVYSMEHPREGKEVSVIALDFEGLYEALKETPHG